MVNDELPYAEHASPWYRPGHIKISDGTYMAMISPYGLERIGMKDACRCFNFRQSELLEIVRLEKIQATRGTHDMKMYDMDELEYASAKYRPPNGATRLSVLIEQYNYFFKSIKSSIATGKIKPVHKIGKIEYYDMDEMKCLVDGLRKVGK
jgi:hypothetical protein